MVYRRQIIGQRASVEATGYRNPAAAQKGGTMLKEEMDLRKFVMPTTVAGQAKNRHFCREASRLITAFRHALHPPIPKGWTIGVYDFNGYQVEMGDWESCAAATRKGGKG
jgi:hypothetical protein